MSTKTYKSIADAERAAKMRIRMINNSRSTNKVYERTNHTVEESRKHGNVKDFTAWKRQKLNKET